MIFLKGRDGIETPKNPQERGFPKRIKHLITGSRSQYHITTLLPGFQQPHCHKGNDHETIILLRGEILAITWQKNKGEFYLLEEEGDSITFLPEEHHALLVLKTSKVVVWGQWMPSPEGGRKAVSLPIL